MNLSKEQLKDVKAFFKVVHALEIYIDMQKDEAKKAALTEVLNILKIIK
jgi:hypothetical protein